MDKIPKFCSGCGTEVVLESSKINQASNDYDEKQDSSEKLSEEPSKNQVHNNYMDVDKAVIIAPENIAQIPRQHTVKRYQEPAYMMYPRTVNTNNGWQKNMIWLVLMILIIAGTFLGYKKYDDNRKKQADEMAFQKELADFKYEVETQWEMLIMNTNQFKQKCDNVFNKPSKDMSLQDKLHNYKTEAVAYRQSLETMKNTLDKIQMSSRLKEFHDLGMFMNDLIVAINTNIDFCDNIINLAGDPKNAKKEAQNKGQDVENSYMAIYRNEEFNKYFDISMRIMDLDSIGGMIEVTAADQVKNLENKNKPSSAVVININGKTITNGGGYNPVPPTTTITNSTNSAYHNQMYNILKKVVSARVEFGKIPQQFRTGQITKATFQALCESAGKQRDNLAQEVQNVSNIPNEEANRHQIVIQCLLAGSAACYNISSELNKPNNGDWETVLKYISDYNTQNLDPVLDYYQIY